MPPTPEAVELTAAERELAEARKAFERVEPGADDSSANAAAAGIGR